MVIDTLRLTSEHWQVMRRHVQAVAPLEACGLLAGKKDRVEAVLVMHNQAQSAVRFTLNAREQLEAFDLIESRGLDLVGIFHSHPAGPETPSSADIAEAAYEVVHVIWSQPQGEWQARAFWIENEQAVEVALEIIRQAIN